MCALDLTGKPVDVKIGRKALGQCYNPLFHNAMTAIGVVGPMAKGTRWKKPGACAFRRRPMQDEPVSEADTVKRAHEVLGYHFQDPAMVTLSLTHSSIAQSRLESNERLELLGDAVRSSGLWRRS